MTGTPKHTPGPWCASQWRCDEIQIVGAGKSVVIVKPTDTWKGDAHLIAAAPDMLAEIDKQIEWLRHLRAEIGDSIRPSLLMGIDQSVKYLGLVSAKARGER